ncbi:MAG TPA: hypothetical protein VNN25_13635, partial [Thermoanaerobaculia bacterium]|nr:hypothetical protein [Thermoanaerobaculia bacterium]
FFDLQHPSKPNRTRSASIDAAGNIRLGNGAKLAGQTPKNVLGLEVVVPPSGGAPYMGTTHAADGGFTQQYLQKDGSFADFHFSFTA